MMGVTRAIARFPFQRASDVATGGRLAKTSRGRATAERSDRADRAPDAAAAAARSDGSDACRAGWARGVLDSLGRVP